MDKEIKKIKKQKNNIVEHVLNWQKENFPNRTNNFTKCERDLRLVLDCYIKDLTDNTINNTVLVASKYWCNGKRQITDYKTELSVHNFMIEYVGNSILKKEKYKSYLNYLHSILSKIIETGPAAGIENLFSKRRQVRTIWNPNKQPSKDLIHNLLRQTQNISPSKQNLYPFKIHAFGPENQKEKDIISQICCMWNKGAVNDWNKQRDTGFIDEKKRSPWVLVFQSRLCAPNKWIIDYSNWVGEEKYWKRFTQCDKERFRLMCNTKLTCIEVGMFIQTLAGLCLEYGLSISYIRGFPEWVWRDNENKYHKDKNPQGLTWDSLPCITEQPLMVVQIGYALDEIDPLATNVGQKGEYMLENKPEITEIVEYHETHEA